MLLQLLKGLVAAALGTETVLTKPNPQIIQK